MSQNHAFVATQIAECLRSSGEAFAEADSFGVPLARQRMEALLSELIGIDQTFGIYREALSASAETASYDEVVQLADHELQRRRRALDTDRSHRLANVFGGGRGRQQEEDDVEYAGGETTAGLVCPLTAKLPEHPIVSTICHHVFECDAIKQYIRSHVTGREKRVLCPVAGCAAEFGLADLKEDSAVTRQVSEARHAQDDEYQRL
jgi:hypothetical protein